MFDFFRRRRENRDAPPPERAAEAAATETGPAERDAAALPAAASDAVPEGTRAAVAHEGVDAARPRVSDANRATATPADAAASDTASAITPSPAVPTAPPQTEPAPVAPPAPARTPDAYAPAADVAAARTHASAATDDAEAALARALAGYAEERDFVGEIARRRAEEEQAAHEASERAAAEATARGAAGATDGEDAGFRSFFRRMRAKLNSGDSFLTKDITEFLPGRKIDAEVLEELETRLLLADVGVDATETILDDLKRRVARKELGDIDALLAALRKAMVGILKPVAKPLVVDRTRRPFVVLVVGVNGSGKTTSIGKLARRYVDQGLKVMLAAGDTFRAAAVEQLQTWGERNGVPVISQGSGADPAAVVFDALQAAKARGVDVLLADTAGRLHNQAHLMEELRKVKRVLAKVDADAPHEVLLVLDASLGQNALAQAETFDDALGVTGLVLTKLDGTAKGGIVLAIAQKLGIPLRFVGIGEQATDFGEFDADEFVGALLATPESRDAA